MGSVSKGYVGDAAFVVAVYIMMADAICVHRGINVYIGGYGVTAAAPMRSAYWLNAYVLLLPRDGRSFGLCGGFEMPKLIMTPIRSGGNRHHNQISRNARDRFKVDAKDFYFVCGEWNPGFRYSPYFKSLSMGKVCVQSAAAMVDAEANSVNLLKTRS